MLLSNMIRSPASEYNQCHRHPAAIYQCQPYRAGVVILSLSGIKGRFKSFGPFMPLFPSFFTFKVDVFLSIFVRMYPHEGSEARRMIEGHYSWVEHDMTHSVLSSPHKWLMVNNIGGGGWLVETRPDRVSPFHLSQPRY